MRKKKLTAVLLVAAVLSGNVMGCGSSTGTESAVSGTETAEVTTTESEDVATSAAETKVTDTYAVTILTTESAEVLVYYPIPNVDETSLVETTCTAPVFMVFGEENFEESTADTYANNTGLYEIAAETGSTICFVNPLEGNWAEQDESLYVEITSLIDDSSTSERSNGITVSLDYVTGDTVQHITGSGQRIYVYGTGSGADYIEKNLLQTVTKSVTYGDGITLESDVTPAAAVVENLSSVEDLVDNDLAVVSIGNTEEVNAALESHCGSILEEETADYTKEYEELVGTVRRQAGVLIPTIDYEEEGITQKIETYTVATSEDNASEYAGTEEHDIQVVVYYDETLDVETGNVPLVLCFHGGGNTALYEAEATQWPLIGKENGFITVSVDLHYPNCSATEIVELIEELEAVYSIDETRIYATGFSMGGVKSWDLYEQYPTVFAGLAPMDASAEVGTDSWGNEVADYNTDVIVPLFYVGGETSPLPELPCQAEKLVDRIAYALEVNDVVKDYSGVSFDSLDTWENAIWGIDGDSSYTVADEEYFTDSVLTVQLFESADGNVYTALASASNQSHEVYARNSWAAWEFLSQFSRNADGSISISQ